MNRRIYPITFATLALSAFAAQAHAAPIFLLGNNPQPTEQNVLMNSGATGLLVTGTITPNGLPTLTVDFKSSQMLLEPSSGQARVSANPEGTPLTNLSIALENGWLYGDVILNPFVNSCPNCLGGPATVSVLTTQGSFNFTYSLANGNNFLTIIAAEGIISTSISNPGGFNDLRQPRISGPFTQTSVQPVPEPASLSLVGMGLLAAARGVRRRMRA